MESNDGPAASQVSQIVVQGDNRSAIIWVDYCLKGVYIDTINFGEVNEHQGTFYAEDRSGRKSNAKTLKGAISKLLMNQLVWE